MSQRKFRHGATHTIWKGKLRVHCRCGKASEVFKDNERTKEQQAEGWYLDHTGLVERNQRKERKELPK